MNKRFDKVFRISVLLKAADALIEIMSGSALVLVNAHRLQEHVMHVAQSILKEDPHDFIATILLHTAHHLSVSSTTFGAIYLLSHGVIKLVVIILVLKNKLWSYPLFIVVLVGFMVYQTIQIINTHSLGYTLLTIFDAAVAIMAWYEWRRQIERHKLVAAKVDGSD